MNVAEHMVVFFNLNVFCSLFRREILGTHCLVPPCCAAAIHEACAPCEGGCVYLFICGCVCLVWYGWLFLVYLWCITTFRGGKLLEFLKEASVDGSHDLLFPHEGAAVGQLVHLLYEYLHHICRAHSIQFFKLQEE